MFAANGILFNHESPRRGATFVTRKVTRGVAAIVAGTAEQALPRQPRRAARLGLRPGVRRGDVADAPAGHAGRLRRRDRRDAHRPRVRGACLQPRRARLAGVRRDRPALPPADRGRRAVRRRVEGPSDPRLAADDHIPGARPDHAPGATCASSGSISTPWPARPSAPRAPDGQPRRTPGHGHRRRRLPRPGRRRAARAAAARPTSSSRAAPTTTCATVRRSSGPSPTVVRTSSSTWRPSSVASAPTARTRAASSTRTRSWASS